MTLKHYHLFELFAGSAFLLFIVRLVQTGTTDSQNLIIALLFLMIARLFRISEKIDFAVPG